MRWLLLSFLLAAPLHANPEELRLSDAPRAEHGSEPRRARLLRGGSGVLTHAEDAGVVDRPQPRRWGVFSAGVTLFAAGWAADIGVSYGMNHANPEISLIPIF